MELYCPDQRHPVNPIQTLQQHSVRDGDTLTVRMLHAVVQKPKSSFFSEDKAIGALDMKKHNPDVTPRPVGLIVQGACQAPRCVNHDKEVELPLGTGTFDFAYLNTKLKCPTCPNRDQFINPPILVKAIRVVNCYWRCVGQFEKAGIL
jgi:hypothetical protein